jgi:hypothetical protein
MNKPIHGAPKPINVPADMQAVSPAPCAFKTGDAVVYTNEYGASFDRIVRGFAATPHGNGRFVYLDTDAWWFPVSPSGLRAASA